MDVPPSKKDICFAGLLVTVLGLMVWGIFSANLESEADMGTEPSREPSSALGKGNSRDIAFRNGEIFLDCLFLGSSRRSQTSSTAIKLKGSWCGEKGALPQKLKRVLIRNVSNGFSGTFFTLPNNAFVTDLIALKEGENQISIEAWSEEDLHFKTSLQIQRDL